jgi:hypothetical protein
MKSEILKRRKWSYKILKIITKNRLTLLWFTLLGIIAATFVVSALLANKGSFTVTLPREQMINFGLVISDTADFARPRHEIQCPPVVDLWNITRDDIPKDVAEIDGEHNGRDYLAMTIYLKNTGNKDLDYTVDIDMNEIYKNLDEALRVEIYLNGESKIYAKRKSNWSNEPEPGTIPFYSKVRIISLAPRPLNVSQVDKYTIVAWVEGNDPDCTNDLLGGFIKMVMSFNAVRVID